MSTDVADLLDALHKAEATYTVRHTPLAPTVVSVVSFPNLGWFMDAIQKAGFGASYSAGSGWQFERRCQETKRHNVTLRSDPVIERKVAEQCELPHGHDGPHAGRNLMWGFDEAVDVPERTLECARRLGKRHPGTPVR